MSRSTMTYEEIESYVEYDNGIKNVLNDFSVKQNKIVIFDADSALYQAAYTGKDEEGNKKPEYKEEEYDVAEGVLAENIMKILLKIEEYFNITQFYIVVKGKNNFRYKLYSEYKSNRPPSPPIINHLVGFMVDRYQAIVADGCEADDVVFSISEAINHKGIILFIDKDLKQMPSIMYNYQKDVWCKVTEEEAKYNFVIQMLIGDGSDGINFTPQFGIKKAEKIVKIGMSNFQYLRNIYRVYEKFHKEKTKEVMTLAYNLLKLHNINNLPTC